MARGAATARGRATSSTHSIPAPIGGLNASDAIAAMSETDALIMDNWFPEPTQVSLRQGRVNWATGMPGWVQTVMPYVSKAGVRQLFGISGTSIYNCTSQAAVGAAVVTGLTNARWEYVNIGTPGGEYLYAANAVDAPRLYDGTTWTAITGVSTPAITGVTTTLLRNPTSWKNRVWFVENNSTRVWYLPVQSIGGAATSLDVGTQFTRGGYVQTIMTFSVSSATSFDDYIGFLSSEGELVVYTGTDPDTPGLFYITGRYNMGKPIGRRCWFKYGADAIVICSDGFVSVSRLISVGIQNPKDAISYKILALVSDAVTSYSGNFGWEGVVYPLGNKLIINVPQNENSRQFQFVMNTISDAWCTFGYTTTPWNAATFCVLGDDLYFGGNTSVSKCDVGNADAGSVIIGSLKTSFSYIGSDRQKRFTMVRPLIQTTGAIYPALALNVDFQTVVPTGTPTFTFAGASLWNVALWDVSPWFSGFFLQKNWQTVTGIGFSAALYMTVSSAGPAVSLMAIDYIYEPGGIL